MEIYKNIAKKKPVHGYRHQGERVLQFPQMNSLKNKTKYVPLTLFGTDQSGHPVADRLIAGTEPDMNCRRESGESGSEHSG